RWHAVLKPIERSRGHLRQGREFALGESAPPADEHETFTNGRVTWFHRRTPPAQMAQQDGESCRKTAKLLTSWSVWGHAGHPTTLYERPGCGLCGRTGTPAPVVPSPAPPDRPAPEGACVVMTTALASRLIDRAAILCAPDSWCTCDPRVPA